MINCHLHSIKGGEFIKSALFPAMPGKDDTFEMDGKLYKVVQVRYIVNDKTPTHKPFLFVQEIPINIDNNE